LPTKPWSRTSMFPYFSSLNLRIASFRFDLLVK
jgi:hypothetical protein